MSRNYDVDHDRVSLDTNERRTVINALYTAAQRYRECASETAKMHAMNAKARESLVSQFTRQADECSALLEKLEE